MNLVRSLFVLATSVVVSCAVQAESASLYTRIRKSLPLKLQQYAAVQQPAIPSAFQPVAELSVTPKGQPIAQTTTSSAAQPADKPTAQSAAPEMQPIDTILPKGTRVVAGDETKDDFYILTEDQPDPVRHLPPAVVEKQLQRMDAPRLLWAFNQPPRADVILSQIAHKVVGTEPAPQSLSAATTAAKPLPGAEKNGDIADIKVALDSTLVEPHKQVVKLAAGKPIAHAKPVHKAVKSKPAADVKQPHKAVKGKLAVDIKPLHKITKNKAVAEVKSKHKSAKSKMVVEAKPQHHPVTIKAAARNKMMADVKPQHKPVNNKKDKTVKGKAVADVKPAKAHHFWRIEKLPAAKKHAAGRHVTTHVNS